MLVAIFGSSQSTSGQFLISLSSRGNVNARENYLARGCVSLCEGLSRARERLTSHEVAFPYVRGLSRVRERITSHEVAFPYVTRFSSARERITSHEVAFPYVRRFSRALTRPRLCQREIKDYSKNPRVRSCFLKSC